MKFGVRECCDVVLRAKSAQKIGNKIFYKNEPVCYFDTLKTSTFEGAATTVYAQGGRGNARLMSWDGERTVTFTMEDALISPIGLSILIGAGLIEASSTAPITQHVAEVTDCIEKIGDNVYAFVDQNPVVYTKGTEEAKDPTIYVMILDSHGEVQSEPYLFKRVADTATIGSGYAFWADAESASTGYKKGALKTSPNNKYNGKYPIIIATGNSFQYVEDGKTATYDGGDTATSKTEQNTALRIANAEKIMVDYYTQHTKGAMQIDITPDKFGGTYYLEASTLWRDQGTGKDLPAEFIIPSCKVQSNFSFSLSSTGDPSSFTFTMDAFPDYTRWDSTEKVLARIQVLGVDETGVNQVYRTETWSKYGYDSAQDNITGALGSTISS